MPARPALQVTISQETSTEMDVSVIEKNNRQFFMVGTIVDHSNDIKSSKLCGSWFHLSFEHFDVISMIDKGIDHGKL